MERLRQICKRCILSCSLLNYQQGMLLKPQHFQLETLFHQENVHRLSALLNPYLFGVDEFSLSSDALISQQIVIKHGTFLFQDGSFCDLADNAVCESRTIPDKELETGSIVSVYVGLKNFSQTGGNLFATSDISGIKECDFRYVSQFGGEEIPDYYGSGTPSIINFMRYNLRIFFSSEVENISDYSLIKIAEIYRDGTHIEKNGQYIPPVINYYSETILKNIMSDMYSLVMSKTRQFEKYKHIKSNSHLSSYEIMLLNIVTTLSQAASEINILKEAVSIHPYEVWKSMNRIVSSLTAYCDDLSVVEDDTRCPSYDHLNLFDVFDKIRQNLRIVLNSLAVGPEYIVKFTRKDNNIWFAELPDLSKYDSLHAYIALSGENIDISTVTLNFFNQIKLASNDAISNLIVRSLSGIPLALATEVPNGLPMLDRGFYGIIDVHNNLWQDMVVSKTAAMLWDAPKDAELIMYITKG